MVRSVAMAALLSAVLGYADGVDVVPHTWVRNASPMVAARSNACAVPLVDGRVLIAGGESAGVALSSAETLANGRFYATAPMTEGRSAAACAILPDGRVLVAGGRTDSGFTNSVEIFDPSTNTWHAGSPMAQGRAAAAVTTLAGGNVLLAGGETAGGISDSLEIYDPQTGQFRTLAAKLSSPRTLHAAASLNDGRVLIAGGSDGSKALDSSDIFDPIVEHVVPAGKMSFARAGLSATTLLDGRVLAAGGSNGKVDTATVELFDPQTGQWTMESAASAAPRSGHVAVRIPNNNTVLFVGGMGTAGNNAQVVAPTEIYIPWRHQFETTGSLETPRTAASVLALSQRGKIVVAGGVNRGGEPQINGETLSVPVMFASNSNYQPGDMIQLSGSGWAPGQAVKLSLPQAAGADATISTVTADASGGWIYSWTTPATAAGSGTLYPTATQVYPAADGTSTVLSAQTNATSLGSTNLPAVINVSDCKNRQSASFNFGTTICAAVTGLSAQTSTEDFAWLSPSGATYAATVAVTAAQGQDLETPNASGKWTVMAYPAGSCTASTGVTVCSGSPDAAATFSVGNGKLAFTTAAQTFPSGGCSGSITVQIQSVNGTAVAPSFPTAVTLTSSNASGKFFSAPGCANQSNSLVIGAGAAAASFSYSDTTAAPKVTATATAFAAVSQTETLSLNSPSMSIAFGSATVPLNGSVTLSFTISNPASSSSSLSGVGVNDTLPAGVAIANPPAITGSCGGTVTAAAGTQTINLAGGTLAAGASCTFSVDVLAASAGTFTNTAQVTSIQGGTGSTASAVLSVMAPPVIALSFSPQSIAVNGVSTLTFAITNPAANPGSISGVAFVDTLPAGVTVAATPSVSNSCGGVVTAAAGSASIGLSGGAVSPAGSCTVTVNVTAVTAGNLTASVQVTSANGGTGNTSSAVLAAAKTGLAHFAVSAPVAGIAGTAFQFTVTALDSANKTLTTYAGTAQFKSSDARAVLPGNSTLVNGIGTFSAVLKTAGNDTITVTDSVSASITGVAGIAISSGAPVSVLATGGTPQSATVNTGFPTPLQVTVKDAYGNPVKGAVVSFSAPVSGASASLQSATATTDSSGLASVSATANGVTGTYTVSAATGGVSASFQLTNTTSIGIQTQSLSLLLSGSTIGTYTVPNAAPYSNLGSFYIDMRITNWRQPSGTCAPVMQFVSSANHGPSLIQLCDPAFGWGAVRVDENIDATPGGDPVWLQAPNLPIISATATNPMNVTLGDTPFPATMSVGKTITITRAAGAGCSGMNGNQVITAVSGNTLTLQYDGSGCIYTANSAFALSQDFLFRYHRDLAANALTGEVWNVDGTGYSSKALSLQTVSPVALPGTFHIGSSGAAASVAFIRWYSGTIRLGATPPGSASGAGLGDWEFEGSGSDSSGNNLNVGFGSVPAYVASPSYGPACSAGTPQSFRVGQTAMLDGSGSFPLDGGNSLTYLWKQIASTEPGIPLQNLSWSSTTTRQPTVTGLAFGPADFQLTVTQGNGQSSSCVVHHGAVAADTNGVVLTSTGNPKLDSAIATLIGPQIQFGSNPWPFYDQVAAANAAVQIADMDVHYQDYWNIAAAGTVGVTTGSHIVTGVGTTFTTTFCQGPTNPTVPKTDASIIIWYLTGRTIAGVPETGRRRMWVSSCVSDTALNASVPSDTQPWTSDAAAGSGLKYTPDFYTHLWEFSGAPANFYDNVQAYYALYYRSGIDIYLAAARKLADRFWTSPEIDRGMAFNVGDWFGAQTGRANSTSGLVLRALDTSDGHPDMWAGLHNLWTYTNWLLTLAYPGWSNNGGIDARETAYTLAQAAYGAMWDSDPTWQAYCRSMIESSFQTGAAGVFPKNVDPLQQVWLQWFQMKSTFDAGTAWSGSTVTLTNGSNVVTCAGSNCGWQASDFVAYDVNTTAACTGGATCATIPVLFTDSANFPANSSHTDPVSYCYPAACKFVDANHFTLDRPYAGTSGSHGWVFGVAGGSLGGTGAGVVGWGGLPYMEGILGWAFDLAAKAMTCTAAGVPSNCDNKTSATAYQYSAQTANWIMSSGSLPGYYGISFFAGFPTCGNQVSATNLWCNKGYGNLQARELTGDAYRGLAAVYRHAPTPALKTTLDNWFAGMWAKPGTNPLLASPDGQYDVNFDPTGCSGCGYYISNGAPYSQKFFGQHFGISNEGGWPAIRLGY